MEFTHSETLVRYVSAARGFSVDIELDKVSDRMSGGLLGYRTRAVLGGECRQSYDAPSRRAALRLAMKDFRDDSDGVFRFARHERVASHV